MAIETSLVGWFGTELGSAVLQRLFLQLETGWERRLSRDIKRHANFRISRRRLTKWLKRPDVWKLLVTPEGTNFGQIRQSLRVELAHGRRGREVIHHIDELLDLIVGQFLIHLRPSMATAIADFRSSKRIDEVIEAIEEAGLILPMPQVRLPPNVEELLKDAVAEVRTTATRLIRALTSDAIGRAEAVRALIDDPPEWLEEAPASIWLVAGAFAEAYDSREQAAIAYERAADLGAPDRARWLVLAVTHMPLTQEGRARQLLEKARTIDPSDPLLVVVDAILNKEPDIVLELTDDARFSIEKQALVSIFQADAHLQREDVDRAIAAAERAIALLPNRSGSRLLAAGAYLMRAQSGAGHSRESDLARARDLALEARDLRREWLGPSGQAATIAARAAVVAGDYVAALRLSLPPPDGDALETETRFDELKQIAINCAVILRRTDLIESLAETMKSEAERLLARATLSEHEGGCNEETRGLYRAALVAAEGPDQRFAALYGLSECGEWPIAGLDSFSKEFPEQGEVILALSELRRGLVDEAIHRLRSRAGNSRPAAATLARAYEETGESAKAARTWEEVFERFKDESALLDAAGVLHRSGRIEESEALIRRALTLLPQRSPSRLQARRMLLESAASRGDWREVEKLARSLIADHGPEPQARWALILGLHNQGRVREAWDVLADSGDLEPRNAIEALLWLTLKGHFETSEKGVVEVLRVTRRFEEDEQVLGSAILTITRIGQRADLSEGTVAESQALTTSFLERFPESSILQSIPADDVERVIETIRSQVQPRDETREELREQAALGQLPLGLLASNVGRPYGEALIRRAAGFIVIGDQTPGVPELEIEAVRRSRGQVIVIESSAIHTLSLIPEVSAILFNRFEACEFPGVSLLDLHATEGSLSMRPSGFFVWDPIANDMRLIEASAEENELIAKRASDMVMLAEGFRIIDWGALKSLKELEDMDYSQFGSWLAPLDLAKTANVVLYSDDIAIRSVARSVNVDAFGTLAALDQLVADEVLSQDVAKVARLKLRDNWAVDLAPDAAEIILVARASGFKAGGAGAPFLRIAFWRDLMTATPVFRTVIDVVAREAPDQLRDWVAQAVVGFVSASKHLGGDQAAGRVGMVTSAVLHFDEDHFPRIVEAIRLGTAHMGYPDPLEELSRQLVALLRNQLGPEVAGQQFLKLVSRLEDSDRHQAVQVLLRP